jgi:1,4-dihydroxy-2-naphthoate octaprenyltransferase
MNGNPVGAFLMALVFLAVTFVIFLICRELMCWYWKINIALEKLERIAKAVEGNQAGAGGVGRLPPAGPSGL